MQCCGVNNMSDFQTAQQFIKQNRDENSNSVVSHVLCTVNCVLCTVNSLLCTVYGVLCTVYCEQSTVYFVRRTVCEQSTVNSLL